MATEDDERPTRREIPLAAVILATVAAALATALFVTVVLDIGGSDDGDQVKTISLQPGEPGGGIPTGQDLSGTPAPDFEFEALSLAAAEAGADVDFAAYRDSRPVVLNFFGSWCTPCVREMPDLDAVSQEMGDDVVFLGLAERESAADSLEIVETTGVTYDIGRDPGGDILTSFQGLAMPTTVFIGADGTITSLHSGALTAADLRARIRNELL